MAATKNTAAPLVRCACASFVVLGEDGNVSTRCRATTRRTFAPGHDAKLKGLLIRAGLADALVAPEGEGANIGPVAVASRFGFGHMVAEGIARGKAAAADKAARAAARKTIRAQRDEFADMLAAVKAETAETVVVERDPLDLTDRPEVWAKVGRWAYKGIVDGNGNLHYLARDGHTRKVVSKYALV